MATAPTPPPLPVKRRRSVSQLNDWLWCSWSYRLKRVVKVQEPPSVWLPGGSAFHVTTEGFDLNTWQENDLSEWASDHEPWHNLFDQEFEREMDENRQIEPDESKWRVANKKKETVAWWRENGKLFVSKYIDWRVSTADTLRIATVEGGPGIEVEVTVPLGGIELRGAVDRVLEDMQTNKLMIADLKSGSQKPDSPVQLATYSLQLEERMGRPIVWGVYYDARKGELGPPTDLSIFTRANVGVMYKNFDSGVQVGAFVPNIGKNCYPCGLKQYCVFQGGTEPSVEVL